MASRLLRPIRPAAAVAALSVLAVAVAACQDEPLFIFEPPGEFVWAYQAPYSGEFRAQDLEVAALVQLTESGSPAYLIDASFKGELTVSPYPTLTEGGMSAACGLQLINPEEGEVRQVSSGALAYPWGALFSPDGERMAYASTEECPSAPAHDLSADLRVLDIGTMESTTLYEGERAPILRGWETPTMLLAMREVPDLGWTYRKIGLEPRSEIVPELVLEYQGFKLFNDRPSPQGDKVLLVDDSPSQSSTFNSELSLHSLITGEPLGGAWEGWLHPQAGDSPWTPNGRALVYIVAGSLSDGMPIDVMKVDARTVEHTPILTGLNPQSDAYLPQAWSPKSEAVLLLTDDRTALHAVNADGSGYGQVAGSALDGPLPTYRNVRWPAGGGYLYFERHGPKPERGVMATAVESEIWAAVVRLPGESNRALDERVQRLESGPWPVSVGP